MSARVLVDDQLAALGREIGDPSLRLNDEGVCSLELEGEQEGLIWVPPTDNLVFFAINVAPAMFDDLQALFAKLLAMNYLDDETRGATLCLDPTHQEILLRYSLPVEHLAPDSVEHLLTALSERARQLGAALETWQRGYHSDDPGDVRAQDEDLVRPDPTMLV